MAKNNETPDLVQAIWNMIGGEKVARALVSGRAKLEVTMIQIIYWLDTTKTSATTEKFVAKDKFKLKKDGGICSYFSENFQNWFLAGDGKIENPLGEQTLRYSELIQSSQNDRIIEELGGKAKAETTLAEMFDLMDKQSDGNKGVLFINSWANIFYIKDLRGELRAVDLRWRDGGWRVYANSVGDPFDWGAGGRVFSRNS